MFCMAAPPSLEPVGDIATRCSGVDARDNLDGCGNAIKRLRKLFGMLLAWVVMVEKNDHMRAA